MQSVGIRGTGLNFEVCIFNTLIKRIIFKAYTIKNDQFMGNLSEGSYENLVSSLSESLR